MIKPQEHHDPDVNKGAVEDDTAPQRPGKPAKSNESMSGQIGHRGDETDGMSGEDTDFPEPGNSPEHSGETKKKR
jgi:hypothetical protein